MSAATAAPVPPVPPLEPPAAVRKLQGLRGTLVSVGYEESHGWRKPENPSSPKYGGRPPFALKELVRLRIADLNECALVTMGKQGSFRLPARAR